MTEVNATEIAAWAGAIGSFISLLSVFYFAGVKMATLTVKVDTMWSFTMRRATSEALQNDLMTHNSPLEITAKGYEFIRPMAPELYEHFKPTAWKLNDEDLALAITRDYGDRLLKEVCIPNDLLYGECLILAIEAVRKNGTIPDDLRKKHPLWPG